jgi:hypothetical protein
MDHDRPMGKAEHGLEGGVLHPGEVVPAAVTKLVGGTMWARGEWAFYPTRTSQ